MGQRTLFVSDLDFTLLRSDGTLGSRTAAAVNELIDAGGLFTYATARSFTRAAGVTAALRLNLPVITYGGAVTVYPGSGDPADVAFLPTATVAEIMRVASGSCPVEPMFSSLVGGRDRVLWREGRETRHVRAFLDSRAGDPRLMPVPGWRDVDPASVFYTLVMGPLNVLRDIRERLGPVLEGCFVTLGEDGYAPGDYWLEIYSAAGTKAEAVRRVRSGVGAEAVVVFGDNLNDVPMFEMADAGFAVSNAVPELLAIATGVIGSNDEEAVATWLSASGWPGCRR